MKSLVVGKRNLLTYSTNSGGVPDIEGFGIDPSTDTTSPYGPYTVTYSTGASLSPTNTPVPMPVKWIYVLQDGTLLSAAVSSPGSKDVVVGTGSLAPTVANPIVGRIAFWTDDETSKVNINTAGEGTYWDTPVGNSQPSGGPGTPPGPPFPTNAFDPDNTYETDLATREPVQNEFQHVPGHPASTCLSTVLGASIRDALSLPAGTVTLTGANRAKLVQAIDALSPYLNDGTSAVPVGTVGGTTATNAGTVTGTAITPGNNRFYANSDELFYTTSRGTQALASTANTAPLVAESRFFLTAHSSAPEVNLFGKPRVAIWPIPISPLIPTAYDNQVALCSTVGVNNPNGTPEPFYFTRSNPSSSTADWTARNNAIYTYLTGLAASSWPGYGGNFLSKYPLDCNQIFTEICDYIRCTNLVDPTPGATPFTSIPTSTELTTGADTTGPSGSLPATGQVVPLVVGATRGAGRVVTISDLTVVIDKVDSRWSLTQAENATLTKNPITGNPLPGSAPSPYYNFYGPTPAYSGEPDYTQYTKIEVALIPQLFCPMAGMSALANDVRFHFSNLKNFSITDSKGTTTTPFTANTQPDLWSRGKFHAREEHPCLWGAFSVLPPSPRLRVEATPHRKLHRTVPTVSLRFLDSHRT